MLCNKANQIFQCCTTQYEPILGLWCSIAQHSNTPDDNNWCLILMCCHVARHCKTANNHNRVILRYLILMCCRVAQRSYIVQEVSHYISNAKLKPMEYRFCDLLCFIGDPRVLDTLIQIVNYAKIKPMEYRFFDLLCFSGDPRVLDTLIQILNYAKFKLMEYRFFDLLCFSWDPRVLDTFIKILNYAKYLEYWTLLSKF